MFEILEHIKQAILRGKMHQDGLYLARIDDDNRVLIMEGNGNEFEYAGITDNKGNYFYIRHLFSGRLKYDVLEDERRVSSCEQNVRTKIECRVVSITDGVNPYDAEEMVRGQLLSLDIPNCGNKRNIRVDLVSSNIDSIKVLSEECPKTKMFRKELCFVYVDFDIYFDQTFICC